MTTITLDTVTGLIRRSITSLPADRALAGGDRLAELGIDSITTLNIVMTAAEEFNLDLAQLDENAAPPTTVDELHAMLMGLEAARTAA